jgi:glyoxylase-like metal-dependent hydrolase (beta-lactamase superfamily II)
MHASEVNVTWPLERVALLEHSDPGARQANIATNTYVIVNANRQAVVIDGSFDYLLPPLRALLGDRYDVLGIALTHRHLAEQGSAVRRIAEAFGVPVLLHPRDAAALRHDASGATFDDPSQSSVLTAVGLETLLFPGHTEGSVMYYDASEGLLFAGDAAMGPSRDQTAAGVERLLRPPFSFNTDDAQLRNGWVQFDRPVRHVLPFHGATYTGRSADDITRIMQPLRRQEPTRGMTG